MVLSSKKHTRVQFDEDLEKAVDMVKTMSNMVEDQLKKAISLFRVADKDSIPALAQQIVDEDAAINNIEIKIHDFCLFIIQKHQPKAQDLRLLFTIVRAASEFERIGDTVIKICETARKSQHVINALIERIEHFAERSLNMLHNSTEALINMDLSTATDCYMKYDYRGEYKEIFRDIIEEAKKDIDHLKEYFIVVIALRQIERIGDRCRNLNEYVYYYAKGFIPSQNTFKEMYADLHPELQEK